MQTDGVKGLINIVEVLKSAKTVAFRPPSRIAAETEDSGEAKVPEELDTPSATITIELWVQLMVNE